MTLSDDDQRRARAAAVRRVARHQRKGTQHRYGKANGPRSVEEETAWIGAEIQCGIDIGRPWVDTPVPDYDGDLGPGVQVRWTHWPNGRLLLHDPEDADDHDFFLVVGDFPHPRTVGWLPGHRGKLWGTVRELQPGRPAICVEQHDLWSVGSWIDPLK